MSSIRNAYHDRFASRVFNYRPQRSCGQGNVFTGVCHSFCSRGGGSPENPPPSRENPPQQGEPTPPGPRRHPPGTRENPPGPRRPPRTRENPPGSRRPPGTRETPPGSRLQHTVYERPVRILLECILVQLSNRRVICLTSGADTMFSFSYIRKLPIVSSFKLGKIRAK